LSPSGAELWHKWRLPLVLVGVILLCGTLIALLELSNAPATGYLDPASTATTGAHAITDILTARGDTVTRASTPAAAEAEVQASVQASAQAPAGSAANGTSGVTLVVTNTGLLTGRQLAGLARGPGDRILIGPDQAALAALAPGVTWHGTGPVQARPPGCALAAARLAGSADMGGGQFATRPAPRPRRHRSPRAGTGVPALCYPSGGFASLVRYTAAGRVITVLGSGNAFTNGSLAKLGNAALALNLLSGPSRIVWLVPGPQPPATAPPGGQQSLLSLIPLPAYLVAIQLAVAVVLAAIWRSRRLGPLVPEPLPVVVRASETVEGHAGLYRSRRARGRAAAALRTAMLDRTRPALGLPQDAGAADVVAAFSARSGSGPDRIEAMLFGPAPRDDAALVALADNLDALEREVRTQ
jgi:hypothetical protein